ncbi:type I glyceraldehyde-3-phosphate dehydrogenase [Gemella cuniculi]|uniref:type I glyceraldehyde-3-phosphate dehydrogenase n=1 Tax=Gemella cuniculi TaxID=150240 RepID=UPI00040E03AE|nr:type I glyceraldehyde-3-phosphate dehydrogenase [Gemella cuniculi]
MTIKVAINGFGRIGRLVLRQIQAQHADDIEVVAVNRSRMRPINQIVYLLKYDTTQGPFPGTVEEGEGSFIVNGKEIKVFGEPDPENLPWKELGVDIVLECSGRFNSREKAHAHIRAGAKKVLLSAPGGSDVKTIVYNVNHEILTGDETVISGASCTTNCLAPMAKVLHDNFGIVQGLMTTIHGYTGDQHTLDGSHKKGDFRRGRAAAENIVPNTTGAAKAIGLVIPELNGKLDGAAQRVPVPTGSLTELFANVEKKVTVEEINAVMKKAANESYGYTEDEIVSSDIVGMNYGSLFDATQTKVIGLGDKQLVKVVAWYDNEMSYTAQLIRTLKHFVKLVK